MGMGATRPWDAADHLETQDDVVAYLEAAFEEGDPSLIAAALGDIARAKGINCGTATRTQMFFVVYKHRGAKLGSNIGKQTSTDAQLAISPHGSVVGQ